MICFLSCRTFQKVRAKFPDCLADFHKSGLINGKIPLRYESALLSGSRNFLKQGKCFTNHKHCCDGVSPTSFLKCKR